MVGHEHTRRTEDRRFPRHDEQWNFEFLADHAGVVGPGAAGDDHGELARVEAAFDGDLPHPLGHVGVDHPVHAECGFFHGHAQRLGDLLLDGFARRVDVELHAAAGEIVRRQVAKHQVRVGAGWILAALAVADRARVGAGALRAHAEQAAFVDPADRAAASANGDDVEHRQRNAVAVDLALGRGHGHAVKNHGGVEAGAAHVDRQAVSLAVRFGIAEPRHRAGRGT